jgi:hypothetical protein
MKAQLRLFKPRLQSASSRIYANRESFVPRLFFFGRVLFKSSGDLSVGGLSGVTREPIIELTQGELALQAVPFLAVADFVLQRGQKVEGYVCRLKIPALRPRDVVNEGPERGGTRRGLGFASPCKRCRIHSGDQSGGNRFDISFDTADLSGKKDMRMRLHL